MRSATNRSSMRVTAVIPARYASTRLPGKPLLEVAGKPMVVHVWEQAKRADWVSDTIVVTDDRRIADVVQAAGGRVLISQGAFETGTDRVVGVIDYLEGEIIVNLQGDEPLIEPSVIDETIRALVEDREAGVSSAKTPIVRPAELLDPNHVKVAVDANGYAVVFTRGVFPYCHDVMAGQSWPREFDGAFFRHIGIYAWRREVLASWRNWPVSRIGNLERLEQWRILEQRVLIKVPTVVTESIGVDTESDLERVRQVMLTERRN